MAERKCFDNLKEKDGWAYKYNNHVLKKLETSENKMKKLIQAGRISSLEVRMIVWGGVDVEPRRRTGS